MALCNRCGGSGKTRGPGRTLVTCKTCKGSGQGRELVGSTESYRIDPHLFEDRAPPSEPWDPGDKEHHEPDAFDLFGEPEFTEGEDE